MKLHRQIGPLVAAGIALSLTLAACGSNDSGDESFGLGQPEPTGDVTTPDDTEAPADSESVATTGAPATAGSEPPTDTTSPAPATTPEPGVDPLPEPSVALLEIGSFDQPVEVTHRPGFGEIFVVEQPGRVIAVSDLSIDVVLDITDLTNARGEQGLLGLAFHPTADLAYTNFTDAAGNTVIAEFAIDPATGAFERASLREVLTIAQPYSNHNGGQLAFGPDQLLYIGVGDGGSGGDPERYALDLTSQLGKILRIDPVASGGEPFTVPTDNPFVDDPTADPTIWAYGLRNPWRFSFDADTGDLWIGDVGQNVFEEINWSAATERQDAARGANFGWSAFEGFETFNDDQPAADAVPPLFVYDHDDGRCSVTGGAVARGELAPDLQGWYVFGDYCSGQIWALDPSAPPAEPRVIEIASLDTLVALSIGPDRDLYAVSAGGTVARIIAA